MEPIQFSAYETAFAFYLFSMVTKNEQFSMSPQQAKQFLLSVNLNQETLKTVFTRFFKNYQSFTLQDFAKLLRVLAAQQHMDVLTFSDAEVYARVLQLPSFYLVQLKQDNAFPGLSGQIGAQNPSLPVLPQISPSSGVSASPEGMQRQNSSRCVEKQRALIEFVRAQLDNTNQLAYVLSAGCMQGIQAAIDDISIAAEQTLSALSVLLREPSWINIDPIAQLARAASQTILSKTQLIADHVETRAAQMAQAFYLIGDAGLKDLVAAHAAASKIYTNNQTKDTAIAQFNKDIAAINAFADYYCTETTTISTSDASGQTAALLKKIAALRDERTLLLQRIMSKMRARHEEGIVQGYRLAVIEMAKFRAYSGMVGADDFWNTSTRE